MRFSRKSTILKRKSEVKSSLYNVHEICGVIPSILSRWLACIFLSFFKNSIDIGEPLQLVKQIKMIKWGGSEERNYQEKRRDTAEIMQ